MSAQLGGPALRDGRMASCAATYGPQAGENDHNCTHWHSDLDHSGEGLLR